MIILSVIRYDSQTAEIGFPIDDDSLERTLQRNYMPTDTTKPFYVSHINFPNVLSIIEGRRVNLDEMNYLAKRLDSFIDDEMDQFGIAIEQTKPDSLKDLINLTFNLEKFTLIKDISDMTTVGRNYVLNTEGAIPADSRYDEKYAQIGRELLSSGRGIITEKGLLFIEDKPLDEYYDGQVFPYYAYNSSILELEIEYNGKSEMVFLPDSNLAVDKAVKRLGAQDLEDCDINLDISNPNFERLFDTFKEVLENDGIIALNSVLKTIDNYGIDPKQLAALIEYACATSANDIKVLMDNIDDFELITDIDYGDYDDVGRFFINTFDDYELSEDLEDFFDFYEFGEYISDEKSGRFVSDGFIYYDGYNSVEEIMDQLDSADNSMRMGDL